MKYIWDEFLEWLGYQFITYPVLTILEAFYYYCHPDQCGEKNQKVAASTILVNPGPHGSGVSIEEMFVEWMGDYMIKCPFNEILEAFYYYCHPDKSRDPRSPEFAACTALQNIS